MLLPSGANQRWSLDFVSDALTDGRRIRTLCVVDDFTREALAITVDTSLSGVRVGRELDRIIARRGIEWHYIAPGKPQQNGFVERLATPPYGSTVACGTSA